MKEPLKILFISQEIKPYLPETEISNICREFPQYVQERGCEIRTFMPCYGHINERRNQLHEVQRLSGMNLILDDTDHPLIIKVASIQAARMQVYFIDNEDYFTRKGVDKDADEVYFEDNDERMIFYVRGVLETIKKLRWTPDVICCNGWMSSVAPMYIKKVYNSDPFFENSKIATFIFDDSFTGTLDKNFAEKVMFDDLAAEDTATINGVAVDCDTLRKLAVDYSDAIVAASPAINPDIVRYAEEKGLAVLKNEDLGDDYQQAYFDFLKSLV